MRLHYTDQGQGQTLVLIHGFCESSFIWDTIVEALSANYRIIALDLPGFGESAQPYAQPSVVNYADDVEETLLHLGVNQHTLIGHSLGGYVALAYAKKYASKLQGLGLFHSTAFADPEAKKVTRTKSIDFIKQHGAETFVKNMFGGLFSPSKKALLKPQIEEFISRCALTPAESIMKTQLAMRDREASIDVLESLAVPVLFIVGKDDQSVSLAKSMEQVSIPKDAVVHILADVGHMGMIEATDQSIQAIAGFLAYCAN